MVIIIRKAVVRKKMSRNGKGEREEGEVGWQQLGRVGLYKLFAQYIK